MKLGKKKEAVAMEAILSHAAMTAEKMDEQESGRLAIMDLIVLAFQLRAKVMNLTDSVIGLFIAVAGLMILMVMGVMQK